MKEDATFVEEGYESSKVLVVSTTELDRNWILDSGCFFRMTPHRDWFETFQSVKDCQVLLGNNKSCEI